MEKVKALVPVIDYIPRKDKIIGLPVIRDPQKIIDDARNVARAIKNVIDEKPQKIIINNKRYIEFDDWQMLGTPFGVTAKVIKTKEIYDQIGKKKRFIGFLAKAAALRDNMEISRAEAECLIYEKNWRYKVYNQRFMLRSMAQTRACSKALSNVLRWVVVLAGYEGTPAEEMIEEKAKLSKGLYKTIKRIIKRKGIKINKVKKYIDENYGVRKILYLNRGEAEELLTWLNKGGNK